MQIIIRKITFGSLGGLVLPRLYSIDVSNDYRAPLGGFI
jgi:hypothetical protein